MLALILSLVFWIFLLWMTGTRRHHYSIRNATSNARQLGLVLLEFESDYGKYPDASTATAVRAETGTKLVLSDRTSNDLFAQLLVHRVASSEKMFYVDARSAKKPDDIFDTDGSILAHGECGFAYIPGRALWASDRSIRPLAFGPVIPGTSFFRSEIMRWKSGCPLGRQRCDKPADQLCR